MLKVNCGPSGGSTDNVGQLNVYTRISDCDDLDNSFNII